MTPKISLRLDDPRLTMLHSAGITGLAMTLEQLAKLYPEPKLRPGTLDWCVDEIGIELFWTGNDLTALEWLCSESFQVEPDRENSRDNATEGLIYLTGLVPQEMDLSTRIAIHQGVAKSFLQHGKMVKSSGNRKQNIEVEEREIEIQIKNFTSYAHQSFAKKLCDRQGKLITISIGIKSWLYPGAIVPHEVDAKGTMFQEAPELALALLFAPVACQFFFLPSRAGFFSDPRIVVVIPSVTNLLTASESCLAMARKKYEERCILHAEEAGWRVFGYELQMRDREEDRIQNCQAIAFQSEDWSHNQRYRSCLENMTIRDRRLDPYYRISDRMPAYKIIKNQKQEYFLIDNKINKILIRNVIRGSPFFRDFQEISRDKLLLQELLNYRKEIMEITNDSEFDRYQTHKVFMMACHKALRTEYATYYARTQENEAVRLDKCRKKIRHELIACGDAQSFRRWLVRFWSGCDENVADFNHDIDALLPSILVEGDWELFRDLALLALVTYPKKENPQALPEEKILPASTALSSTNVSET